MVTKRQQDQAMMAASRTEAVLKETDDELTPDGSIEDAKQEEQKEEQEIVAACMQGASERQFDMFGHTILMKLLNVKEEIQAASLAKSAQGTSAYSFALETAYFALSCMSIDRIPFYTAISSDGSEAPSRWKIALTYYRPFIDEYFKHYSDLRNEQEEKLKALEK